MDWRLGRSNESQQSAWLQLAAVLPFLVVLGFIAYLGWHSRYLADDFCTAGWMQRLGFFESQAYWREHWSGRFSYFFLANSLHLLGPWTTKVVPSILLVGWTLSTFLLTRRIQLISGLGRGGIAPIILGIAIPAATLGSAPSLYQSILWQTGALTYVLPLVLITALAAWALSQWRQGAAEGVRWWQWSLPTIAAFAIGGFSETMAAVQIALLLGCIVLTGLLGRGIVKRQSLLGYLLAALAGAVAALILVVTVPGNSVRQGLMETPAPILQVLTASFRNTYLFSARIFNYELGWAILSFSIPFITVAFGTRGARQNNSSSWLDRLSRIWLALLAIPVFAILLVVATMAPSEYALGSYPDGRVLVMAHFWVMAGAALWGGLLGWLIPFRSPIESAVRLRAVPWLIVFGLGIFLASGFIGSHMGLLADARQFARSWDQRHQQLQAAEPGQEPIQAASLSHMGGAAELERDPDHWVNRCVAMTYGLNQVVAK
ncbi:MAG: DUF6056 family protein [Anaerolineales bacterium]